MEPARFYPRKTFNSVSQFCNKVMELRSSFWETTKRSGPELGNLMIFLLKKKIPKSQNPRQAFLAAGSKNNS